MNKKYWLVFVVSLLLTACGGSSSEDDDDETPVDDPPPATKIDPLELPEEIDLFGREGDPGKNKLGTDYADDRKRVHTWDQAMEPLEMVNEILCYVSQSGADQLVNETYTALVNPSLCEKGRSEGEDTGQSSGNNEEYQLWTIVSERASNDEPQTVKIWVPQDGGGGDGEDDPMDQQQILVELTISTEGSDENPHGEFIMNWTGIAEVDGAEFTTMQGTIQAALDSDGNPKILFYDQGGSEEMGGEFSQASNIVLDADNEDNGAAKTARSFSNGFETFSATYNVSYNATHFLRGKDDDGDNSVDEQLCTARDEFDQFVWRYNLYNESDESRLELNSGFPFFTTVDQRRVFGFVGYWGMWVPHDVDVDSITEIVEEDHSSDTQTAYDVVHAPGKLIKRTKSEILLSDLDGAVMNYENGRAEYTHDMELNSGDQVEAAGFYLIAIEQQGEDGRREFVSITPQLIDEEFMFFWSESLGGAVNYDRFHNENAVTIYQEDFVRSAADIGDGATSLTLDCYHGCLKSDITSAQINEDGDSPYLDSTQEPGVPTTTYTFNFSTLTLEDSEGNPIALASDATITDMSPHQWGIHAGPLIISGTVVEDGHDIWNQDVSYAWETGQNHWNLTTAIVNQDTGELVTFDKPMNFLYTHSNANDLNADDENPSSYDGQAFMLQYGGAGELWGIPHEQNDTGHFIPVFSLNDGTVLSSGEANYLVKGIDVERRMRAVSDDECTTAGLNFDSVADLEIPTSADLTPVTITLADKPEVTDSPRVIAGEVQD